MAPDRPFARPDRWPVARRQAAYPDGPSGLQRTVGRTYLAMRRWRGTNVCEPALGLEDLRWLWNVLRRRATAWHRRLAGIVGAP